MSKPHKILQATQYSNTVLKCHESTGASFQYIISSRYKRKECNIK